ncbi:MAG: alpha-hydroxy-acid oxidizing protein [Vicinamibacterales bacterium]
MGTRITRREALTRVVAPAAATDGRLVPRDQLVCVPEYEGQAQRALAPATASLLADRTDASGDSIDRVVFDRITLRPRMLVPTLDLDLTVTLFGDELFAPILVAPVADQKRFHPDGEVATLRGAALANAPVIVSGRSSVPLSTLQSGAGTPLWSQVFAADPAARERIREADEAGCRAICLTVGVKAPAEGSNAAPPAARTNWADVARLIAESRRPVIVKGVSAVTEATTALQQGAAAIMVSNYGGATTRGGATPILELPAVVDAVGGRVPVFVDGGFRRGTDILKALASGAQAVAVGRPVMWGLAAYGADGVRGVLEMLQTELARYMAMCGKSRLGMLTRDLIRVHGVAPPAVARR